MGTTGLVAQARGRGDAAETGALLTRALMIAAAAGALLIAGQAAVFDAAFWIAPAWPRSKASPAVSRGACLGRSGDDRDLRCDRLADRHGAHPRGSGAAARHERRQCRAVLLVRARPRLGHPGGGGCDADRGMVGSRPWSLALPFGLRGAAVAGLGPRLRPREAAPHGAGERRHHAALGRAAGQLHHLHVLRRGARRRDAGGEPGAAAVPGSPPMRSMASLSPPRRWSARRWASTRARPAAGGDRQLAVGRGVRRWCWRSASCCSGRR